MLIEYDSTIESRTMKLSPFEAYNVPAFLFALAEQLEVLSRRDGAEWYVPWVDGHEIGRDEVVVYEAQGWVVYARFDAGSLVLLVEGDELDRGAATMHAATLRALLQLP